uniref:Uncharacterized protein n=1 Tax=Romanomermis culicivorax TaxID=13658 RepID=A0A915JU18_ROMCU
MQNFPHESTRSRCEAPLNKRKGQIEATKMLFLGCAETINEQGKRDNGTRTRTLEKNIKII